MNNRTRLAVLAAAAVTTVAGTASATTINSFLTGAVFHGINVTPATNPAGGANVSYTVTLDAGAYMTYQGNDYAISSIIGFYALSYGHNLSQPSLSASGLFAVDNDHKAAGSIYGWKANPNSGITAGNSHTFTYQTLANDYTQFGFHVAIPAGTFFPGTTGQTGSITGTIGSNIVPTPGAAAILGVGGLASFRRRRP